MFFEEETFDLLYKYDILSSCIFSENLILYICPEVRKLNIHTKFNVSIWILDVSEKVFNFSSTFRGLNTQTYNP